LKKIDTLKFAESYYNYLLATPRDPSRLEKSSEFSTEFRKVLIAPKILVHHTLHKKARNFSILPCRPRALSFSDSGFADSPSKASFV